MKQAARDQLLQNLDRQLGEVRQFLPTLATREEMNTAITAERERTDRRFDELCAAIKDEGDQTRRHMDAVAESLRNDLRSAAEGYTAVRQQVSALEVRHTRDVRALDARVSRLENDRGTRCR